MKNIKKEITRRDDVAKKNDFNENLTVLMHALSHLIKTDQVRKPNGVPVANPTI